MNNQIQQALAGLLIIQNENRTIQNPTIYRGLKQAQDALSELLKEKPQPSGKIEQLKSIVQELETCSHQWERQNSGSILIHNICTKCKTENFG